MEPCSSIYIFRLVIQFGFFLLFVNQKTVTSHKFGCDREYTLGMDVNWWGTGEWDMLPTLKVGDIISFVPPHFSRTQNEMSRNMFHSLANKSCLNETR